MGQNGSCQNIDYKKGQEISTADQQSLEKTGKEMGSLEIIKKDLESIYKEFIIIAFSFEPKSEHGIKFIKLEKRLNNAIKKAQDLYDTLEDAYS